MSGTLVRTISTRDAIAAVFNVDQTLVLITAASGSVEIRKERGTFVRTLVPRDAVNAIWVGNDVAITTVKGTTQLRKANGTLIRTM